MHVFVRSYFWGVVADKKGRKPVIVYSGLLMAVCTLAFGFSVNVGMAVIIRLLTGAFGGEDIFWILVISMALECLLLLLLLKDMSFPLKIVLSLP